jgi:hypothetical protein
MFLVRAQEHDEEATTTTTTESTYEEPPTTTAATDTTVTCDCTAHVETAKQETSHSFQSMIDDLNHRLQEAVASVTGKDGEIATLNGQLQEVTSTMTAKVDEMNRQLAHQVQESEIAVQRAMQAGEASLEQIKASLKHAQEETKTAQQQVSKYLNQRFFINMTLLKQDFNSLLKKLGLNKSEDL